MQIIHQDYMFVHDPDKLLCHFTVLTKDEKGGEKHHHKTEVIYETHETSVPVYETIDSVERMLNDYALEITTGE